MSFKFFIVVGPIRDKSSPLLLLLLLYSDKFVILNHQCVLQINEANVNPVLIVSSHSVIQSVSQTDS